MITNFHARTSPPLKLVFEFLNDKGEVAVSATVDVPALEANATWRFAAQAIGPGIVAWRYRRL